MRAISSCLILRIAGKAEISVESTFNDKLKSKSNMEEEKVKSKSDNNLNEQQGDKPSLSNDQTSATLDPISESKSTNVNEESVIEFV